jgi:hypothetical protein
MELGVTRATISSDALMGSRREAIAEVDGGAFDVRLPVPRRPIEFAIVETAVLALLTVGVVAQRLGEEIGRRLRWATQMVGLIVSLAVRNPWCGHRCPMRTIETALLGVRELARRRVEATRIEYPKRESARLARPRRAGTGPGGQRPHRRDPRPEFPLRLVARSGFAQGQLRDASLSETPHSPDALRPLRSPP